MPMNITTLAHRLRRAARTGQRIRAPRLTGQQLGQLLPLLR